MVILILAIFFSINMGGATFAAAFGTLFGAKLINRHIARAVFLLFVILGAVLMGGDVATTLGEDIIPRELLTERSLILIFFSAGISMFCVNLVHIPQSTSLVTVSAISGVGAFYHAINMETILFLIPFWIGLPLISFGLTYFLIRRVYPPNNKNLWIYEKLVHNKKKITVFVIMISCYSAFSVGTNNVANVVGPLLSLSKMSPTLILIIFASMYGIGAYFFKGGVETVSTKIVPLGLLSVSIIALVSGTLMIVASYCGVPQSFVMLQMGAVFAVSGIKDGKEVLWRRPLTQKILYTWTINPIGTFFFTYGLSHLFL